MSTQVTQIREHCSTLRVPRYGILGNFIPETALYIKLVYNVTHILCIFLQENDVLRKL